MEQKIITRKLARVTTSWNPTDIPEGWTVKQISTTSIVKAAQTVQRLSSLRL